MINIKQFFIRDKYFQPRDHSRGVIIIIQGRRQPGVGSHRFFFFKFNFSIQHLNCLNYNIFFYIFYLEYFLLPPPPREILLRAVLL